MIKLIILYIMIIVELSASQLKLQIEKIEELSYVDNISLRDISVDYNPFSMPIKKKKEEPKNIQNMPKKIKNSINLVAILNNKAFINGKWYKKNDKINDYRVLKIDSQRVVLKKGRKLLHLKLGKNVNILKITEMIK